MTTQYEAILEGFKQPGGVQSKKEKHDGYKNIIKKTIRIQVLLWQIWYLLHMGAIIARPYHQGSVFY